MAIYDIGDKPRLTASFKDEDDALADPTIVTLQLRKPDGSESSHVYGQDGNVVKDAVGQYHYDLLVTQSGDYFYRWKGEGAVVAADERKLQVRKSKFTTP